ncbi:MAG: hypothetical protein IJK26_00085 [Clostridia bacterium]|nr:hypothetical protein [Clostridia bacterium]
MKIKKNCDVFYGLTDEQKKNFLDTYANHPLADYIDWKAFYNSDDGNEMNFVKAVRVDKDEDGNLNYVLEEITENDEDYELIYFSADNEIRKTPAMSAEG